jgi:hypothetical protein
VQKISKSLIHIAIAHNHYRKRLIVPLLCGSVLIYIKIVQLKADLIPQN